MMFAMTIPDAVREPIPWPDGGVFNGSITTIAKDLKLRGFIRRLGFRQVEAE
jgi:hypothetical protein